MIHANQRLDSTYETVIKYNEPQAESRVYTIGHIVKTVVNIASTVHNLQTVKVWQDVFSKWPYDKPIVDYWIWAAPETIITASDSYTVLDLLAEVGGLVFMIVLIGRYFLEGCARGSLVAVKASRLYTWKDSDDL